MPSEQSPVPVSFAGVTVPVTELIGVAVLVAEEPVGVGVGVGVLEATGLGVGVAMALAGVARGVRHDRRCDWVLAGAALGLTHYGFEAGRLFYTPLVLVWLVLIAADSTVSLHDRRRGLWEMAAMFALTVLPVYGAVLLSDADSLPRLRASGVDIAAMLSGPNGFRYLVAHAIAAARVYVIQPEVAEYYGGDYALLLPVLVPFFLVGAVSRSGRQGAAVIVPLSLIAVWLANTAMRDTAVFARWVVALPAVALATAVGIDTVARVARGAAGGFALGIALAVSALQVHYYFAVHIDRLAAQARAVKRTAMPTLPYCLPSNMYRGLQSWSSSAIP